MKELFGCEVCRYDEATEGATVVCLGFFDCVHNGHRRVIETAKNIAKSLGAKTAAFTFRSDPHAALGSDRKEIYTFDERALRMSELGVDEIARHLGFSRAQLYRKIKSVTNYSPLELIILTRLRYSRNLMLVNKKSISEAAYESGFSSPSHFTKTFRKYYGQSPSDFIKETKVK